MKKFAYTLVLITAALMLVLVGCAEKEGDFELARSEGITVSYLDEVERMTVSRSPLTSTEILDTYCDTAVRGTVVKVRNIQIDYGKGEISQKALATINVKSVISGDIAVGTTVTVLLPNYVDTASTGEDSVINSYLINGTEGIFLLKKVTSQSRAEIGEKTFYYDDICDYSMFDEDHFAIVEVNGKVRFNADMFNGKITDFATLDEAEAKIRDALKK